MKYSLLLFYLFSVGSAHSSYYITNITPNSNQNYTTVSCTVSNVKKEWIKPCTLWSAQQFAHYFSVSRNNPLIQYPLYAYPAFRNYIKNLLDYKKHIEDLHTKFHSDKKSKKDLLKDTGFSEKKFKKIVCKLHKEIQEQEEYAQKKVRCHKQKQEDEKKRRQQLKEMQQNTMRQQEDRVDHCVLEWQDRFNNADYNALYLQKRLDAFDKKGNWQEVTYHLSYDAHNILRAHKLNSDKFGLLYGNEIQHVLHRELVEVVNECAQLYRNYASNSQVKMLSERVFECADLGVQYNRLGNIAISSRLADFCSSLFKYVKAIAMGLIQGIILDEVDMLMHPMETAKNILGLMYNVVYYAGTLICEGAYLEYLQCTDPQSAQDRIQAHKNNAAALIRALYTKSQELSGPDIVQGGVRILSGIATGGWLCSRVYKTLKVLPGKITERAAEFVRVVQEEKRVAITGEGFKARLVDCVDKAKDVTVKTKLSLKNIENSSRKFLEIKHPVLDSIRSGSALKLDKFHAFSDVIDNFARYAKEFIIKGGDGIKRRLYQIEGSLNGQGGIFEWIVDSTKGVTHRLFIKNGKITGKPNIFRS